MLCTVTSNLLTLCSPTPHTPQLGLDVVVRATAPQISSGAAFWTDANGREMVLRRRDYRPGWSFEVRGCTRWLWHTAHDAGVCTSVWCCSLGTALLHPLSPTPA